MIIQFGTFLLFQSSGRNEWNICRDPKHKLFRHACTRSRMFSCRVCSLGHKDLQGRADKSDPTEAPKKRLFEAAS